MSKSASSSASTGGTDHAFIRTPVAIESHEAYSMGVGEQDHRDCSQD